MSEFQFEPEYTYQPLIGDIISLKGEDGLPTGPQFYVGKIHEGYIKAERLETPFDEITITEIYYDTYLKMANVLKEGKV